MKISKIITYRFFSILVRSACVCNIHSLAPTHNKKTHTGLRTQMSMPSSSQAKKGEPDLILYQILPLTDGVRYVRKIAELAGVDLEDARVAFRSLLLHGVIAKIDIFQFSNIYRVTSKIQELASSTELQERCVQCVCPDLTRTMAPESSNTLGPDRNVTKRVFQNIFRTYCSFRGGINVEDVLKSQFILNEDEDSDSEGSDRIDPNRLVVFGVVCGFLRTCSFFFLFSLCMCVSHFRTKKKQAAPQ